MKGLYNYFSELYERTTSKRWLNKIVFIALGIVSTGWFLVRVIPKPSRATYPCMQAASPFMSAFVIYLLSLWGGVTAFKKYKQSVRQGKVGWAAFCMVAVVASAIAFTSNDIQTANADITDTTKVTATTFKVGPNQPVGTGYGIFPGRVTWAHIPGAASWTRNDSRDWYLDQYNDQDKCDEMMRQTLLSLTGATNERDAWAAIFRHFNQQKRGLNRSFEANEKIAIKLNNNNTRNGQNAGPEGLNTSPHMVLSLLRSLINEGGFTEANVTVGDPSRSVFKFEYDKWHNEFPNVKYVDKDGGNGRTKATYTQNVTQYSPGGTNNNRNIETNYASAEYLINFAIPKLHGGPGVTLIGKNWVGMIQGISHHAYDVPGGGNSQYMTFADHAVNKHFGGKTVIFLIDALYGTNNVDGYPSGKWQSFNNDWPSSLWASLDPVAIDAVAMDFMAAEWNVKNYVDVYLHEAATIPNSPSGVKYQDGNGNIVTQSPGVLEHWNNDTDKEYSRNLGRNYGIELFRTVAGPPIAVNSISLNKTSTSIAVGSTEELTVTYNPRNATNKRVSWSSSNNNIATVDEYGVVTAKAAGTATITVTSEDGNKTATCNVTTFNQAVTGVSLKANTTIGINGTEKLIPTFQPTNASNKNVTWSSSNNSIATVNQDGLVTAKAVGTAIITVTTEEGNRTATCAVTVSPQPPVPPGTNLSLRKPIESSDDAGDLTKATQAVDGNRNSRWESKHEAGTKVLTIDLEDTYCLSEIVLVWEAAYASQFNIEVSTDKNTWTTVRSTTSGQTGEQSIVVNDVNARYVRINCLVRATAYGYSLFEVEVFGDVAAAPKSIVDVVTPSFKVYNTSDGLVIEGVETAAVYNIDGSFVATVKGNITLPKGIYIVKAGNKTEKVIVK